MLWNTRKLKLPRDRMRPNSFCLHCHQKASQWVVHADGKWESRCHQHRLRGLQLVDRRELRVMEVMSE